MNTEASTDDLFSFGTKNPDNGRTAVPTPEEEIKDFFPNTYHHFQDFLFFSAP